MLKSKHNAMQCTARARECIIHHQLEGNFGAVAFTLYSLHSLHGERRIHCVYKPDDTMSAGGFRPKLSPMRYTQHWLNVFTVMATTMSMLGK